MSLALSAITVSGGGWGTEKENQAVLVLPGSYTREEGTSLAEDTETGNPIVESQRSINELTRGSGSNTICK